MYVDHTGEPTWLQRAWGAVLTCQRTGSRHQSPDPESAALHGASALRCHEGVRSSGPLLPLHVVVEDERRPRSSTWVEVLRSTVTLDHAQWHAGPPRTRYEHAVIEVAAQRTRVVDVVADFSRAVGSRRTTPGRLLAVSTQMSRLPQRTLLDTVLRDLATGACSALEHGYLHRVERAHSLPPATRQLRGRSRTSVVYRDASYDGLIVELDGRAGHDSVEQRDADADRDLLAALVGATTVRLTWGQVFDRSCWTAAQIARLLGVTPRRCGAGCTVLEA